MPSAPTSLARSPGPAAGSAWSCRLPRRGLGYRRWELSRHNGRTLAGHRVSFVIDQQPHHQLAKLPVGERLRMLAVFSLPEGAGALNLRRERHALTQARPRPPRHHRHVRLGEGAGGRRRAGMGWAQRWLAEAAMLDREEPGWR
jgi:hypothetical protein